MSTVGTKSKESKEPPASAPRITAADAVNEPNDATEGARELTEAYRDAEGAALQRRASRGALKDGGYQSTIGELLPLLISHESGGDDLAWHALAATIGDLRILCQLLESASHTEVNDNREEMVAFLLRIIYRAEAARLIAPRMPKPIPEREVMQ